VRAQKLFTAETAEGAEKTRSRLRVLRGLSGEKLLAIEEL